MKGKPVALRVGVAVAALSLALTPLLGVRAGASPGSSNWVPVAQGFSPSAFPGSTAFGTTAPNTPETVSFILDEQNKAQLEASVEAGTQSQLSVSQFAQQYGQSQSNIRALVTYLDGFHIQSNVYADDVDVSTTGTAGEYDAALSTTQDNYHVPALPGHNGQQGVPAQNVYGTVSAPELPSNLASFVLAVLGLTNYAPFTTNLVHTPSSDSANTGTTNGGNTSSCVNLTGLPDACNLPQNFEENYGLTSLEGANAGQGQTLAIVTLAAVDPGAPQYFWSNIAHVPSTGRTFSVVNIDGGPGAPSDAAGSGETDLDLEQSGSIAPASNVIDYQAPNTDPGFADAFFTAASQNLAGSISTSWGESETVVNAAVALGEETSAYEAAFDEAFLELDAQGQATFVAAGDAGAYDASDDLGTTNLSIDTPADSPYVTAGGGTTLAWSGSIQGAGLCPTTTRYPVSVSQQRAWGWDYLWSYFAQSCDESFATAAETDVVGGGGGFSSVEATPSYQLGVSGTSSYHAVEYLTPTDYENVYGIIEPTQWNFNPNPSVTQGAASGRAVPDLSADADPFTGYLLYEPSFATAATPGPVLQGGWGGTSFVAPQLNGSAAVIDGLLGHRTGFWNPSIYAFATSRHSPFTTLSSASTSNDNIYYTGNPGDVYNAATGLGVPNLAELASDFQGN